MSYMLYYNYESQTQGGGGVISVLSCRMSSVLYRDNTISCDKTYLVFDLSKYLVFFHRNLVGMVSKLLFYAPKWYCRPLCAPPVSKYIHIYNLYYFQITTSDPYDKTQGQIKTLVTLTYLSRSQKVIKEKSQGHRR